MKVFKKPTKPKQNKKNQTQPQLIFTVGIGGSCHGRRKDYDLYIAYKRFKPTF